MRPDLSAILLLTSIVVLQTTGTPVDIQVGIHPERPVALYEGPPTFRRDSRGRPFKSIIVTSKPFGIGNSGSNVVRDSSTTSSSPSTTTTAKPSISSRPLRPFIITSKPFGFVNPASNFVRDSSSTTTTTTTTPQPPIAKGTPTIPFFSISCTVGSSCSQIISARQTPTAKPTFKPYTKEEISKYKGTLSSRFPPKVDQANVDSSQSSSSTSATTTEKPATANKHLWRIRTTLSPSSTTSATTTTVTTTTTRRPSPAKNKPSSIWNGKWKWPTHIDSAAAAASEDGERVKTDSGNQRIETVTPDTVPIMVSSSMSVQREPSSASNTKPYQAVNNKQDSRVTFATSKPSTGTHNGGWFSMLAASLNVLQSHQSILQRHQPQQQQQTKATSSTPFPVRIVSRPTKPRTHPTTIAPANQDRWNSPTLTEEANSLVWKPDEGDSDQQPISPPRDIQNYHHHEVISNKGNKISLITGASTRNKQANKPQSSPTPPPEVSVSSHVIGLRVKPKSLGLPTHIEHIQGVAIETDGESTNLSDLIMKQALPPSRPSRYLQHPQRSSSLTVRNDRWNRPAQQRNVDHYPIHSFETNSGWRPLRFPTP